jgi:hypothetical protein
MRQSDGEEAECEREDEGGRRMATDGERPATTEGHIAGWSGEKSPYTRPQPLTIKAPAPISRLIIVQYNTCVNAANVGNLGPSSSQILLPPTVNVSSYFSLH